MALNPILLTVWIVLAVCFVGLLVYRSQLTRYEDDQLFLNEAANQQEQQQQTEINRRLKRLQPVLQICGGAAGLVTASIVGMYVYSAWRQLQ